MPKRTGLLASVAMPLISMSLMVPSAHAAMPSLSNFPLENHSQIIRVQDQQPAPGGESEEELKLRQKKGAPPAEGEGRPRPPEGAERPRGPAGEAPRPPRAEPAPEARPSQEAPQQRRQAEPEAQPAPKPRAEPRPEPEQPKPRPAPTQEAAPEPKAAPVEPKPAPKEAPAARSEPKPEAKPAAPEPKAEAKPEAPAPKPAPKMEAPAEKPAPTTQAPAEQSKPAPKGVAPAPDAEAPAGERPRRQGGQGGEPGQRPPREAPAAPNGVAPNGAAPADATQPPAPAGKPAPVPPGEKPAPVAPGTVPPPAGDQRSAAPPLAPAPAGAAAQTVETPKTPEDIQRAKKIAENPASATGPVVLPVENGAAVLDSAKESGPAQAVAPGDQQGMPRDRRNGQRPGMPPAGGPQQAVAPNTPPPPPPTSDAAAQAAPDGQRVAPVRIEDFSRQRGERLDQRPRFQDPRGWDDVRRADDGRVIIQFDNRTFVRHDDSERFVDDGYRPEYERLPGDRTREVFQRDNGVQVVTIRNRYGEVIQRSRIGRDGREYVLFYAPELADERDERDYRWRDPGAELPPMRLTIPVNQYIIDTTTDPNRDYYRFLEQPPVERVERVYSVDEVRYSARIRDKVRRIDLDTITFATGSADIPMNQASSLRKVADAIKKVLDRDPAETFLIEGHTDAVGSDESNLVLSDRRAESVARVLTDAFGIPPENMVTQGYGERYLKVATDGPEQQNRRVTIRRITALVKPVAQNQ